MLVNGIELDEIKDATDIIASLHLISTKIDNALEELEEKQGGKTSFVVSKNLENLIQKQKELFEQQLALQNNSNQNNKGAGAIASGIIGFFVGAGATFILLVMLFTNINNKQFNIINNYFKHLQSNLVTKQQVKIKRLSYKEDDIKNGKIENGLLIINQDSFKKGDKIGKFSILNIDQNYVDLFDNVEGYPLKILIDKGEVF